MLGRAKAYLVCHPLHIQSRREMVRPVVEGTGCWLTSISVGVMPFANKNFDYKPNLCMPNRFWLC